MIDWDEWYPWYFVSPNAKYEVEIEVTDEELVWIERGQKKFAAVQEFLKRKVREAEDA